MHCLACGAEMILINIMRDETLSVPGFEHHTFRCSACHDVERRLASARHGRESDNEPRSVHTAPPIAPVATVQDERVAAPRVIAKLRARYVLAAALVALPAASAGAASWLETNFYMFGPRYDGVLPPCDYPEALEKIAKRFNRTEGTFWNSDLTILNFAKIRETAFRPWAAQTIPRRFCSGIVEVSDGRKHTLHYSIAEDTGMIGAYWGVEWCVVGLDRNWAYNPACEMARP